LLNKQRVLGQVSAPAQEAASADPAAARKAAEEAEERRLAEIRSHGTMVTPATFAEWKARFDAEMALARCARACMRHHPCAEIWQPRCLFSLSSLAGLHVLGVLFPPMLPFDISDARASLAVLHGSFLAVLRLARAKLKGEEGGGAKDKGPTGKQFFLRLEADGKEVRSSTCCLFSQAL
jgi:hypothetical protein